MAWKYTFLTLLAVAAIGEAGVGNNEVDDKTCEKDNCVDDGKAKPEKLKCPRKEIVNLEHLELEGTKWIDNPAVFFIESSGRPRLTPRQACAVESAALHNADMTSLVVMTAKKLDLSVNSTCQLHDRYAMDGLVAFRTVEPKDLFRGIAPMEEVQGRIEESPHKVVHLSDAMRLALLHRFGGWYSDLDMVHLRPLMDERLPDNGISGDQHVLRDLRLPNYDGGVGPLLNNAICRFKKPAHPFVSTALAAFAERYDPADRLCVGPRLLTAVLRFLCVGMSEEERLKGDFTPRVFTPERCQGVNVLPQAYFYPIGWFEHMSLYQQQSTEAEWDELFRDSFTVHLYASGEGAKTKIRQRRFYGAAIPAYLHLASKNCPASLQSERMF